MAKRHFDHTGFPKLPEIIDEITHFIQSLEVRPSEYQGYCWVGLPVETKRGFRTLDKIKVGSLVVPGNPFRVNGIYVVGGQAMYLPDFYNKGNHDLDLKLDTNTDTITEDLLLERILMNELNSLMNDGELSRHDRKTKEFAMDLLSVKLKGPVERPYLQIYPTLEFRP